jgi:hypothetical protein
MQTALETFVTENVVENNTRKNTRVATDSLAAAVVAQPTCSQLTARSESFIFGFGSKAFYLFIIISFYTALGTYR